MVGVLLMCGKFIMANFKPSLLSWSQVESSCEIVALMVLGKFSDIFGSWTIGSANIRKLAKDTVPQRGRKLTIGVRFEVNIKK